MCSYEKKFTTANFNNLPRIENFFAMKFLEQQFLYVNNMCSRFHGQKINTKKDIYNLPTCVVWETIVETILTTANFDTLPRAEKLLIYYEIFFPKLFLC